jgi:hypothetical protein
MSTALLLVLSAAPLACYFWVLALWHGGHHPRLVSGRTDFLVLAAGVGGLLTFGPFGQIVMSMILGEPSLAGWVLVTAVAALGAVAWGRRAGHRLVIYHIDPESLDLVLQDALDLRSGRFRRILGGFEDRAGTVGLSVEASRRFHYAVITARGEKPEGLLADLRPALANRLEAITNRPSPMAWWLLALSALTMFAMLGGYLLVQPMAREAVRLLFNRLRGA